MRKLFLLLLFLLSVLLKAQDDDETAGVMVVKKNKQSEFEKVMREKPANPWCWRGCGGVISKRCFGHQVPSIFYGVSAGSGYDVQVGLALTNKFYTYRAAAFYQWSVTEQIHSFGAFYQKTILSRKKKDHGHMIMAVGLKTAIDFEERKNLEAQPYLAFSVPRCTWNKIQLNIGYQWNKIIRNETIPPNNAVRLSLWFYL